MQKILIRADESADWIVAGLRQLDRILRVLGEVFPNHLKVWIVWDPAVVPSARRLPDVSGLSLIELQTAAGPAGGDVVLDTRMFLGRNLSASEIAGSREILQPGVLATSILKIAARSRPAKNAFFAEAGSHRTD